MTTEWEPVVEQGSLSDQELTWAQGLDPEVLPFTLGGRDLARIPLRALTLTIPFTQLSTDIEANLPHWNSFPSGIDVAVAPAQPVAADPPRLTILPYSIRYVISCSEHYFVDLRGSFPTYLQKFKAKPRHNLTRTIRKFTEFSGGQIQWRELRSPDEMSEFRNLAIEVSRKTWQESVGGPGFPRAEEFERAIIDLAIRGLAHGYVLFHRGRPIAYAFCRAFYNHLFYNRIGYDRDYAAWSPGTVLLYVLLERLFAEATYSCLDLGEGTLPYKAFFSTGDVRCARTIYFRRSLWNLVIVITHMALTSFSRKAGSILKTLRLKERVKGFFMGELRRPSQ